MDAQESIRQGLTKIIYVTPERLNNEGFVESMIQLRQRTGYGVGLIAIDESHCVSECEKKPVASRHLALHICLTALIDLALRFTDS